MKKWTKSHLHRLKKGGNHSEDMGIPQSDATKARHIDEHNLLSVNDELFRKLDFGSA